MVERWLEVAGSEGRVARARARARARAGRVRRAFSMALRACWRMRPRAGLPVVRALCPGSKRSMLSARGVVAFAVGACLLMAPRVFAQGSAGDAEAVFGFDSPIGPIEYRSARGLRVGETGLNIGGFSTVEIDKSHGEPLGINWDNISFLVLYEPIEAFRIFTELEVGDLVEYQVRDSLASNPSFQIERLYAELSLSDRANLRFGKFQTPVGRWNLVPAEPFVWTASDPVLLDTAYDEHQTGLTLSGTTFPRAGALEYWLYGQVLDPLDPSESPRPANRSVGGRLQFTKSRGNWSVGSSLLATEREGEWSYLGGLDLEIHYRGFELLAEFVYQNGAIAERDIAGGFVQGRVEFLPDLHLVTRYEHFNRLDSERDDVHIGDVGLAWQPKPWLILKATYRFSTRETEEASRGLSSSISVVF